MLPAQGPVTHSSMPSNPFFSDPLDQNNVAPVLLSHVSNALQGIAVGANVNIVDAGEAQDLLTTRRTDGRMLMD